MAGMKWFPRLRQFLFALALISLALTAPAALAQRDLLAEALALPVAGGLVGARNVERFAWIENAGGVRNVWVAEPGRRAWRVTAYTQDDGVELSDLELRE